jgi:hypothetical protein
MNSTKLVMGLVTLLLCALMISTSHVAQAAPEAQPEMRAAMEHLREAQKNLEMASHDKGGHRVKALEHVRQAIHEVEIGIEYDNTHPEKK